MIPWIWIVPGIAIAVAGALLLLRGTRDRRRVARGSSFLERTTPYRVMGCLGMGREGVVFRVRERREDGSLGEPRALKLLDAREGRGLSKRERLANQVEAARAAAGLQDWACLPRTFDSGVIRAEGRAVAYDVMELVEGETLTAGAARGGFGDWPLEDRLAALDDLLAGIGALSRSQMNFIHIDADNVMVTPDRRLKLIDLSGFRRRPLTARRRRRIFRRLARTVLLLLHDRKEELLADPLRPGARDLFDQLELYRDLPKGSRPPREAEFFSIDAFRAWVGKALMRQSNP